MDRTSVTKKGPTVGMWMYQNSGGTEIQNKIIKQLEQRGISVVTGLDLAQASAKNGQIL